MRLEDCGGKLSRGCQTRINSVLRKRSRCIGAA